MKAEYFKRGIILLAIFFTAQTAFVYAENDGIRLQSDIQRPYRFIEKSNFSRYDNGKYTGHVFREVRAAVERQEDGAYLGNYFVLEETLRDLAKSARSVNAVIPAEFFMQSGGGIIVENDRGFPPLRGFPSFPDKKVLPGDSWTSGGEKAADPLNNNVFTVLPIVARYEYTGEETYRDTPVHHIKAKYAVRYNNPGAENFSALQGSHDVDILLRAEDCLPLLMRDRLDETYTFPDGRTIRFKGFTLTFGEGITSLDKNLIVTDLHDKLDKDFDKDIVVEETGEGVRLTLKNLRFKPDSPLLLDSEQKRLDAVADSLKAAEGRDFLVEGHTAFVGQSRHEMELSIERAKTIIAEMVRRGIKEDRFIYKGWGSAKPAADNSTEEGKSLNRRVEITILQ